MAWKEIKVKIPDEFKENIIDILNNFDSGGVVISDISSPLEKFSQKKWKKIIAYYPEDKNFVSLLEKIKEKINSCFGTENSLKKVLIEVDEIEDKDWSTSWHEYFTPTPVGNNFMVCPSWLEPPETNKEVIEIDPGQAFGVGTHESTFIAALMLEKYLKKYDKDIHILDVGTGTAILSIIAAKLDFRHIFAIDISEDAIRTAKENIQINNISSNIALQKRDIMKGIYGKYEVVIANLLPDIIDKVLGKIVKYTKEEGIIILSGIIDTEFNRIINFSKQFSLTMVDSVQKGEWFSCVLKKG